MTRSALVSGGAGFIGSHVADILQANGFSVTVIDNLSSGQRGQVPAGATFHHADIRSPEAAAVVRDGAFDVICHLAAQIDVRKSVDDPIFDAQVNVAGSLNILEAVRASGKRTRVVFSSTGGAIYGDDVRLPTSEDAIKAPQSPYGTAKLSVEYYLSYYARVHGLDTVALRYANVYGPRQDPHGEAGVVAIFCNRLIDGAPLTVFGDGEQTRDYVFVGDVARANFLAATSELPPAGGVDARSFNVGTSTQTTVLDLARVLSAAAGVTAEVRHGDARPGEQRHSVVDVGKAARVLGWRPTVDIAKGLPLTYQWFLAQRSSPAATLRA